MRGFFAALAIWCCAAIAALAQDAPRLPPVGVMVTGAAPAEPLPTRFREVLAVIGTPGGARLDNA